jgi:histone-lysine N-methyltransferase SETMAR
MDQNPIVLYLRMKGMSLDAIHDDLVRTLGKDVVAYSTVTKYARAAQFPGRKEATHPETPDVEHSPVDEVILTALAEFPFTFLSVREPSRRICLPRSTVHKHRHLAQLLRFTVQHLRWVPHFLTAEQKQIRVQMAIKLLQALSVQSTRQWHDIVTLDESWIYLFSEHDLMWTVPGEIVDRERHTVQLPKFMRTVVWNPIRFHVLKTLPKGRKFNTQYYPNDILVAISDWRRETGGTRPNKLWVHSNHAWPPTVKMPRDYIRLNRMKQVLHLPYSPDLAPSDFFFFGYVKGKLMGYCAESPSELLVRIRVILTEIPREALNVVFFECLE